MALQKDSEPVQKITIVPRTMGALGYTMQTPEEEKYLSTKDEMLADLVAFYGGRAAEEIKFDSVTTGASNDIERATSIARSMVTQYGMSDKFGMIGLESISGQYLDGRRVLECSEVTEAEIDKEVMRMLNEAYEKAIALLRDHMETLDKVAEFLLEQETITGKEFMKIFHEVENKQDEVEVNQAVEAEMETVDTVEVETTEAEASESKTE
jgi:cell division protease FtsH